MKLKGEVNTLENTGDSTRVTLTNVKASWEAEWRSSRHNLTFEMPQSNKAFHIGRVVKITIEAK